MDRITDLLILEHFTNSGHTYGKYWFKFRGVNTLVLHNDDDWRVVSNFLGESVRNCVSKINDDVINELKEKIEFDIIYLWAGDGYIFFQSILFYL